MANVTLKQALKSVYDSLNTKINNSNSGGSTLLERFFGITEATEFTAATSSEITTELGNIWESVWGSAAPAVSYDEESESESEENSSES